MIGTQLAHYQILERIGAGGMGEVYLARDTSLGRDVAIKVLPPGMARDPARLERFEREARALASLNHPNIVTVHSVESDGGVRFLTMELLEGKTLSKLIGRGGLPLGQFFDLALPLTDALAAAHAKGVTHRDLKPGNIMVDGRGRVKVLDFGLAKRSGGEGDTGGALSALPTKTFEEPLTEEGRAVGTTAYMSPEQAEGKAVDHRSDIFSLGIVLYEMATGVCPFKGDTPASTISSILRDTPSSVTQINRVLPRDLGRIIMRCLAKEPERRFQTALDVRNELEELKRDIDSGELVGAGVHGPARSQWSRGPMIAGTIIVGLVVVTIALRWGGHLGGPRSRAAPDVSLTRLTRLPGSQGQPAISPDGAMVAFVGEGGGGKSDIFLQRADGENAINLTNHESADDDEPAFSPDGSRIAFRSERDGGGLFVMGATGESPRRITDFGHFPSWSPDGTSLLFSLEQVLDPRLGPNMSQIWTADVATGKRQRILDAQAAHPVWSPHGLRIAYWAVEGGRRDIWTVRPDGTDRQAVTRDDATDWRPLWSPDGRYLYFVSDRGGTDNLWRVRVNERSGRPAGDPEPLTTGTSDVRTFSLSRDGRRCAASVAAWEGRLEAFKFDPDRESVEGDPKTVLSAFGGVVPDLSADGQWIAYMTWGKEDIVVARTDGTALRRLTDDSHRDRLPSWSADGDRIIFFSNRSGKYEIWTIRPDGSGLQRETDASVDLLAPAWSPDGSRFSCTDGKGWSYIADAKPGASAPRRLADMERLPPFGHGGEIFLPSTWSPDGNRIAGTVVDSSGRWVGIVAFAVDTRRYATAKRFEPQLHQLGVQWLPDGRRLMYQRNDDPVALEISTGTERVVRTPKIKKGESSIYSLSRDGQVLLRAVYSGDQDIWLIDLDSRR